MLEQEIHEPPGHSASGVRSMSSPGGALDNGPAAVVVVSDYHIGDVDKTAAKVQSTRAQIPMIVIAPVKVKEDLLSDFMTVSGAQRFAATDPTLKTALRDMVAKSTRTKRAYSYRFHYKANLEGLNPRPVQVALANHPQINTSAKYQVPAPEVRVPPASVAGLYLTISVGGQTERRHLGGVQFNERGTTKDDPNNAVPIDEARNALNGLITVTVEPPSPRCSFLSVAPSPIRLVCLRGTAQFWVSPLLAVDSRGICRCAQGKRSRSSSHSRMSNKSRGLKRSCAGRENKEPRLPVFPMSQ
jgi:hypothetical protein